VQNYQRTRPRGFTLVELLTVIAIIALLAGILFPVFMTAREAMRQGTCSTNISELIKAAKMYKDDWGAYPDALYAVSYNAGPLEVRLGDRKYVANRDRFTCPNHVPSLKNSTALVTPQNYTGPVPATDQYGRTLAFAALSSYDVQLRPNAPGGVPYLNYSLKWQPGLISAFTDRRQLIHREPPADTVVTWCLYHAMDTAGQPRRGHNAIVGFLDGRVRKIDAAKMANWPGPDGKYPWQVAPDRP
jgi:prepilin-type N-terminal cleavage/methylation domain-containing protein